MFKQFPSMPWITFDVHGVNIKIFKPFTHPTPLGGGNLEGHPPRWQWQTDHWVQIHHTGKMPFACHAGGQNPRPGFWMGKLKPRDRLNMIELSPDGFE